VGIHVFSRSGKDVDPRVEPAGGECVGMANLLEVSDLQTHYVTFGGERIVKAVRQAVRTLLLSLPRALRVTTGSMSAFVSLALLTSPTLAPTRCWIFS